MSKFLLKLNDFNRIHAVLHGVILALEGSKPNKSCLFFNVAGGYILKQIFGIDAQPVAGAYSMHTGIDDRVAFFGRVENSIVQSDPDAFHVWLQTNTHIIDFLSPIYREAFDEFPETRSLPRKMFQRKLSDEASHPDEIKKAGDFRFYPNLELTNHLLEGFMKKPAHGDLVEIATEWIGSRNGKQKSTFSMHDGKGKVDNMKLATTVATGAW